LWAFFWADSPNQNRSHTFASSRPVRVGDQKVCPDAHGTWNVYDSLGEALLRAGNADDATLMYEKSLALNPESPTGQEALKNIKEGTAAM
jgi:hypothetical protein